MRVALAGGPGVRKGPGPQHVLPGLLLRDGLGSGARWLRCRPCSLGGRGGGQEGSELVRCLGGGREQPGALEKALGRAQVAHICRLKCLVERRGIGLLWRGPGVAVLGAVWAGAMCGAACVEGLLVVKGLLRQL